MTTRREIFERLRFYAIYDAPGLPPTTWLDRVIDAGFGTVQIRDKRRVLSEETLAVMARRAARRNVTFLVNDDPHRAEVAGAHGVHLGPDDRSVAEVREQHPDWIIGASARTTDRAATALRENADYLGVGPVYATDSKANLPDPIGWRGFDVVADSTPLPCVAIGGLTPERIDADASELAIGFAFLSAVSTVDGIDNVARWIARIS